MKVLFISSWYPNSENPLKGIYVKKHAEAIKQAGVDIQVVAITVSPSSKTFEKKIYTNTDNAGMITHQIELNSRFYKWIHLNLFFQYRLIHNYIEHDVIKQFKPDIIHANVLYPSGLIGYKLSKRFNLPLVITEHWSKVNKFMNTSLFSYLGKKAYENASAVTVVSQFLKNNIKKYFENETKIRVVANVVNTAAFVYKSKIKNEQSITFLCTAHWTSPKRPDLIFHALNSFSKIINQKVILNIVGEGHLINELKSKEWNFSVNYKGNLSSEKLAEVIQSSDYFLHASEMETFSIVIAEALAAGTPVLASNVGAIPELINTSNGLTCHNTIEDWVNSLKQLVEKEFNREEISKQTLKFSADAIGKQFVSVYNSVKD